MLWCCSTDEASMQSMVQAVLNVAAQAGVAALAVPLLGAGRAHWPVSLMAKALVAKVLEAAHCTLKTTSLKKLIFANLNSEAVAALRSELARQGPQFSLSLSGTKAGCEAAVQHLYQTLEARQQGVQLDAFGKLSCIQQESVLDMQYLSKWELQYGALRVHGDAQLVSQVQCHVAGLLANKTPYVVDCPANSFPSHWAPQQNNTELVEVELGSPETAELMAAIRRQASIQVIKVHRIQNKKLWKHFAFHYSNMLERWNHEPNLNLVNGGLPQLWHRTSSTEPKQIYASEQGFALNFARKERTWGAGTYYSCKPTLATRYDHRLQRFNNYLADLKGLSGVKQVMAVDVLTGKSTRVHHDHTIRSPPKIEDESIGMLLGISEPRYDSVEATHPDGNTPIYITYNSGHGYPKYLITYTT